VTKEVTVDYEPVILSSREWAVLEPLLARPGLILSRAQLQEKLFSWKDEVSSNAVEVCYPRSTQKSRAETDSECAWGRVSGPVAPYHTSGATPAAASPSNRTRLLAPVPRGARAYA
jgi:hypothetical protein